MPKLDVTKLLIEKKLILISVAIIILYWMHFFVGWGDIVVYQHDNLDSNIVWYKLLADTHTFFAPGSTIISNVMEGIPRAVFPNELNLLSMLYYLFDPMAAYMINEAFIRVIAFTGMYLLLSSHFCTDHSSPSISSRIIQMGTSLVFALLPYWSNGGASIAGQPLVLYAFLNLKNKNTSYKDWVILLFFPLYSSLILAGMFVLAMLTVIFIYDCIKTKRINSAMFIALFLMSMIYLGVEYRLVETLFNPGFTSHRVEFSKEALSFHDALHKSIKLFFTGQYHAHSIHGIFLLPFIFIGWIFIFIFKKKVNIVFGSNAISIIIAIMAISLFGGFEDSIYWAPVKDAIPLLKQIQFDRFYFLFALLWFLLFAITAVNVIQFRFGTVAVSMILIAQMALSFGMQSSTVQYMPKTIKSFYTDTVFRKPVSFNQFYAVNLFQQAKEYIGLPVSSYRIMQIGYEPNVGLYNGFYTVDGYFPTYSIEYKHAFREVIAPQLEVSQKERIGFDTWGSRCQLMSQDKNLYLNLEALKKLGGKYIFSAYQVEIKGGHGVQFLHKFTDKNAMYDLYVYRVL